jgi:hypothetical protein
MIETLFEKYRSIDTVAVQNKIKYLDSRIKRHSQVFLKRETQFAFDQKTHITNILERNIEWDNLTSIKNPETNEIIIEPREIKKVIRNFFKKNQPVRDK